MIITIKGADFSSANIGTLSTYIISKSIGSGASFDIPNFVDKNSSVNWVITLNEGYTFGTYSVTMGGVEVTPTVVDNVMTISIAEVTGNVRIVVATVNENTGEEELPDVPPVTPDEPENPNEVSLGIWELGSISSSIAGQSSTNVESTTRIRTKSVIPMDSNLTLTWDDSLYKVAYYYYDNTDNVTKKSSLNTASYAESSPLTLDYLAYDNIKCVRLVIAKKNDGQMTTEDLTTSRLKITKS